MKTLEIDLGVSDALALLNQTLEFAYPNITIVGELSGFRISKNRWLYFDLKDETGILRFFGTVYNMPGPIEDGMMLRVVGAPRIHPQYGFSINVLKIQPVGEGSLKKAYNLLKAKLTAEGLFDPSRKRQLPYPPDTIGLITSRGSAAEADFMKITKARWPLLQIDRTDVHVQGEQAVPELLAALTEFNESPDPPETLVITRGGGSAEDLAAFNDERLTRAIATSRIPTIVAIGHESDISLAELAADARASTPSNAAELLVPDVRDVRSELASLKKSLSTFLKSKLEHLLGEFKEQAKRVASLLSGSFDQEREALIQKRKLVELYNPRRVLERGYSLIRSNGKIAASVSAVNLGDKISAELSDGTIDAEVRGINKL